MAETGRWNGHVFTVSPGKVLSFKDLQVKGSSETDEKKSGSQKYVSRKNGKPVEISLTVKLHAATGCDVRKEAMALVSEASNGKKDYFYIGGSKLVTCQVMLVNADVKEVTISPANKWLHADVALTLKQCSKNGSTSTTKKKSSKKKASKGGGSGTGGGSGGGSSNKVSVQGTSAKQTSGTTSFVSKITNAYASVAVKAGNFIKSNVKTATLKIDGISSAAYTASSKSGKYASSSATSSTLSTVYKNTIQPAKTYSMKSR